VHHLLSIGGELLVQLGDPFDALLEVDQALVVLILGLVRLWKGGKLGR